MKSKISARKQEFTQSSRIEVVERRAVEVNRSCRIFFRLRDFSLVEKTFERLHHEIALASVCKTQFRGSDMQCRRADLEAIRSHALERCFKWDRAHTRKRIEHRISLREERAHEVRRQRRLHFSLVRTQRMQTMSPVALRKIIALMR